MTHQTLEAATPTMPLCGRCQATPASVVYRAKTENPVPRCWDCAPPLPDAIALGWMDPPTGVDRRDRFA